MFINRSWSKVLLSAAFTVAFTVVTACGSPSLPVADAASKTAASKTTSKTTEPAKGADTKSTEKAAAKPAQADKKGAQLAANYSFKEWDNKTPKRWTTEPADKVLKTTGSGPNSVYTELKPSGTDKYTTLRQRLGGKLAGKTVTVTLRAKSSEAKMLSAKFSYETKSGLQTVVLDASGRGGWESVTKTMVIPADAKEDSAMVAVILRPAAKKPALVDYLSVKAS